MPIIDVDPCAQLEKLFSRLDAQMKDARDVFLDDVDRLSDGGPGRLKPLSSQVSSFGSQHLYRAYRDVFPPIRTGKVAPQPNALGVGDWHGDLVQFSGGELANGEPCRSAGHWNPRHQAEVFQVLEGKVHMLTAVETPERRLALFLQTAASQEIMIAPAGAWHVSYAPEKAIVFNIYSGPRAIESQMGIDDEKYLSHAPLPVWLVRSEKGSLECETALGRPVVQMVTAEHWNGWLHEALRNGDVHSLEPFIERCDPEVFLRNIGSNLHAVDVSSESQSLVLPYSCIKSP